MEFIWKGKIKVVVGEFTRAGQFDYFTAVGKLYKEMPEGEYGNAVRQIMIQLAPTKVYVCEAGNWRLISDTETIEEGANVFKIAPVMTEDLFQQLPGGLAKQWVMAADREQGYLVKTAADFFDNPPEIDVTNSGG